MARAHAGIMRSSLRRRRLRWIATGGAVLLLALVVIPPTLADTRMREIDLASGDELVPIERAVDEGALAVAGAAALVAAGAFHPDESSEFVPALRSAYARMRAEEGVAPVPLRSRLGGGSTALVVEPRDGTAAPQVGVVFLHGFAGAFSLMCWEIARAADAVSAVTVCPSAGFRGAWWTRQGERRAREAIAYLRARGVRRIYLAGLSNGGIGASLLAPRLARRIDGLILVSGVSSRARPIVPTLVVHGTRDHMTPAAPARAFARRAPRRVRYVPLDATHFMLVEREDEVRAAIGDWLAARERQREGARAPRTSMASPSSWAR